MKGRGALSKGSSHERNIRKSEKCIVGMFGEARKGMKRFGSILLLLLLFFHLFFLHRLFSHLHRLLFLLFLYFLVLIFFFSLYLCLLYMICVVSFPWVAFFFATGNLYNVY